MKNNARKTKGGSTHQEYVVIPITDLAEQAVLDRRCREAEKAMAAANRNGGKRKSTKRK